MPQVLIVVGAVLVLAGLAGIAAGMPDWLLGLSLGSTLIQSGTIGFVGGLVLIGLALVLHALQELLRRLDALAPARGGRVLAPASPSHEPSRALPEPLRPAEPPPARHRAPADEPPRWLRGGAAPFPNDEPARPRRDRPSAIASEEQARPRRNRPPAAASDESVLPRRDRPPESVATEEPLRARRERPAEQAGDEPARARGDVPEPVRRDEPLRARGDLPPFADERPRPRAPDAAEERPAPRFRPVDLPPVAAPDPAAASVVRSGIIGGMAYTLYSDGSIEAELPIGTVRFNSIAELQEHVNRTGAEADVDFEEPAR